MCLALGTYLSLYPALLIFPLVAIFHTYYKQRSRPKAWTFHARTHHRTRAVAHTCARTRTRDNMGCAVQSAWVVGFTVVACYAAWLSALFYLSFLQLGSWGWLKEVRKARLYLLIY